MKRSITFKEALVIVIALHVIGVVCIMQFAAYKARIAKQIRDEKRAAMLSETRSPHDWNPSNVKPRVVATAPLKLDERRIAEASKNINIRANLQQLLNQATSYLGNKTSQISNNLTEPVLNPKDSKPSRQKLIVQKNHSKQASMKLPKVVQTKRPNATPTPAVAASNNKNNVQTRTIKTVSFNNGIVTQSTEEFNRVMSSHIVLQ